MVYILDKENKPLMPTNRHGKARRLLKLKMAEVVRKNPFTIKLLYDCNNCTQPITLGVDSGTKHQGFSATSEKQELYTSQIEERDDIKELLVTRREARSTRRSRKTRYRAPRFNNRISSKHKGWLAPSVEHRIDSHIKEINLICSILPVTSINIEVADFDLQKLKADLYELSKPVSTDYQEGEMPGFSNLRQYILYRDNYKCKCCKGASKDNVLEVHHLISRKIAGNAPSNLITLCKTCHDGYHAGNVILPKFNNKSLQFKDSTQMGIMKWNLYNRLKMLYPEKKIKLTYGYITKFNRIKYGLEKSHVTDTFCTTENFNANRLGYFYLKKKVRCHNRQIHKFKIEKGGVRKLNQAPFKVKNFELFDKVEFNNQICFITGRRTSGYFALKDINYNKISDSVKFDKLKFISHSSGFLEEIQKY